MPETSQTRPVVTLFVVAMLCALPVIALIMTPRLDTRGRGAYDQMNYHQRVIETFAGELPTPDLGDYLSATTPGYHLALSLPAALEIDTRPLRLIGALFGLALVLIVAGFLGTRAPPLEAIALTLPLVASWYIVQASVWLLPDAAAWACVACVLVLSFRQRLDIAFYLGGALALAALVLMRQIHLWAAAPIWVAAWYGAQDGEESLAWLVSDLGPRVRRAILAGIATAPAFIVIGAFVALWGGLVPPTFQNRYGSANPATPAFVLALCGVFSIFFAGYLWPSAVHLLKHERVKLVACLAIGALIAIVPETTFNQDAGRWTGLWRIIDKAPTIGERSPLLILMSVFGAAALLAWWQAMRPRPRLIAFAALAGFAAAQTASHELWQRYHEPFLLMLMAMMAVQCRERGLPRRAIGPALLAIVVGCVTVLSLVGAWRSEPKRQIPLDELQDVIDRTQTVRQSAPDEMSTP